MHVGDDHLHVIFQGEERRLWVDTWVQVCPVLLLLGRVGVAGSLAEDAGQHIIILTRCATNRETLGTLSKYQVDTSSLFVCASGDAAINYSQVKQLPIPRSMCSA